MAQEPDPPDYVSSWGDFYEFIEHFRQTHPRKDWKHVLAETGYAMRSSPSFPELEFVREGIFRFRIEFDDGRIVVIEFEQSANGIIEPVKGGMNRD